MRFFASVITVFLLNHLQPIVSLNCLVLQSNNSQQAISTNCVAPFDKACATHYNYNRQPQSPSKASTRQQCADLSTCKPRSPNCRNIKTHHQVCCCYTDDCNTIDTQQLDKQQRPDPDRKKSSVAALSIAMITIAIVICVCLVVTGSVVFACHCRGRRRELRKQREEQVSKGGSNSVLMSTTISPGHSQYFTKPENNSKESISNGTGSTVTMNQRDNPTISADNRTDPQMSPPEIQKTTEDDRSQSVTQSNDESETAPNEPASPSPTTSKTNEPTISRS